MSLQVWLPLTKDLRQQGLSNVTVTNNGATFNSAGKLGGCYSFGNGSASSNGLFLNSNLVDLMQAEYSVGVWVKPLGNHYHYNGTIFSSGNWNNTCYAFGLSQDNSQVDILCKGYNVYVTCAVPTNTWTHLTCTCDSTNTVRLYKNGEYIGSSTRSNKPDSDNATQAAIGRETYADGYFTFNGMLNDFRLYDHCLSPMEVKELAKGLVLHYPLNGGGLLGSQYDSTIYVESDGSLWTHIFHHNNPANARFNSTDNFAAGVYLDANRWYDVEQLCNLTTKWEFMLKEKLTTTSTENKYRWIQTVNPNVATWNDVKPDSTNITRITTSGYSTNTSSGGMWRYNSNTRMVLANSSSGNWYGAIGAWTNYSNAIPGRYDGTDAKCSTGYEDLYLRIDNCPVGIKSTIEYDCSGFCNNGIRMGTFTYTSDTPKYSVSIRITAGSGIFTPMNITFSQYTIAFWAKHTVGSKMLMGSCPSAGSSQTSWYWYGDNSFKYPSGEYYYTYNGGAKDSFKWTHFVATYDGANVRVYRNGVSEGSKACTGDQAMAYLSVGYGYGSGYTENSNMSDFRIYATALSADEVLSLYQNSAYIDSSGNVYGAVHSEV